MCIFLQHQLHASQQPARILPAAVGAHLYSASAVLMGAADALQVDRSPTAGLQALLPPSLLCWLRHMVQGTNLTDCRVRSGSGVPLWCRAASADAW